MAQKDWPAGVIRKTPVVPAGPYQDGAASGVWTLDQATYWLKQGLWPIAGNSIRAVFGSGESSSYTNVIDYISISSTGNATDFGDMYTNRTLNTASCASGTRCFWFAGSALDGAGNPNNIIQYVTFSTTGNSTDFGDATKISYSGAGCNSSTRGLYSVFLDGGASAASNVIDYITMATAGNANDFGDLTLARYYGSACSSPTIGVFLGGMQAGGPAYNTIDYVTIATAGNATDFGDLSAGRSKSAGCSSSTRGLVGGGASGQNNIVYITIATAGNATTFGSLSVAREQLSSCSSNIRGVWAGGSAYSNIIDYVTIASTGNASDFGDLTEARGNLSAGCSANGGLQ